MNRRTLHALCAAAMLLSIVTPASADYPDRPVRIVAPVAAGGGVDVLARLIAQGLSEKVGQTFYVENKPGAGGVIGSQFVIKSPPDGYNLLLTPSSLSLAVAIRKTPPYDVAKDFTPIINIAIAPYALIVNKSVPVKSVPELVAYAKANPTALSYSSGGIGTASHLAAELFKMMSGIEMVHVPNKGVNPAVVDLITGQVQVTFAGLPAIQAQKSLEGFTLLGLAETKRSALMPDLPTIAEQGLSGFATNNWLGLLGPPGMDPAIVTKLRDDILSILAAPDVKEKIKLHGYDFVGSTPAQFGEQMIADVERWSSVVTKADIPRR